MTEQHQPADGAEEVVGAEETVEPTTAEAAPLQGDILDEGDVPEGAVRQGDDEPGQGAQARDFGQGTSEDSSDGTADDLHPDTFLAAERLGDLQRLQAEYVNYKRRVDRDRAVVQERAAQSVIEALLPVLDDIHAAREHGDLVDGPFAAIADKLESTLVKFGLERYGAIGELFDPSLHEALMHTAWPQDGSVEPTDSTTVVQVLQPGYRAGERVLRAARVAVADPE
ncbi:MAG: nucleotide exchange factor GrpE [Pedococcus sp.]